MCDCDQFTLDTYYPNVLLSAEQMERGNDFGFTPERKEECFMSLFFFIYVSSIFYLNCSVK